MRWKRPGANDMRHVLKVGLRYVTATPGQSALLVAGVAVGVFVFIFMSALIGGLAVYLVRQTLGDVAHVVVEAPSREAKAIDGAFAGRVLVARQHGQAAKEQIRSAATFAPVIAALPGVVAVSPQIAGNGFLAIGETVAPIAVSGVEPDKVSAIANLESRMVAGSAALAGNAILIGKALADELGLGVGRIVRLRSSTGVERAMTIGGVYRIGLDALDKRAAFVALAAARGLFGLPHGVSRIEIKLADYAAADRMAAAIAARTGLAATSWTSGAGQLQEGLKAQANTGYVIQGFALVTIVIGVASALMLSTYRRRSEIGIMRAMGASRAFIVLVFMTQGTLIGLIGGLAGAGLAYLALSPFPPISELKPGMLPIDIGQGAFLPAVALTALGAVLASILPARAAARVDPVQAINQ